MKPTLFILASVVLTFPVAAQDSDRTNADPSKEMEATDTRYEQGLFLWYELMTTEEEAARQFYSSVIGWETQAYELAGGSGAPYTMWMMGDSAVGGMMEINTAIMGEMPPHWRAYISVSDVDSAVGRAQSLGATLLGQAFDVTEIGRMAFMNDPQGAPLALFRPEGDLEQPPWPPAPLTFSWNELATTDYRAAFEFYHEMFGWEELDSFDMGDGWMYLLFGEGERMYGGIFNQPPEQAGTSTWLYYIRVVDIAAALERVRESGGQVLTDPMEVPGGDLVAQCVDPQGAVFALHQTGP